MQKVNVVRLYYLWTLACRYTVHWLLAAPGSRRGEGRSRADSCWYSSRSTHRCSRAHSDTWTREAGLRMYLHSDRPTADMPELSANSHLLDIFL